MRGTARLLDGYVYDDDAAHGIYFLEWRDGDHSHECASLTTGLGAFHEGMGLTDEPARDRPEVLGAFLPRETALRLPYIDHLWHVADHIVLDDPRISIVEAWLQRGASQ